MLWLFFLYFCVLDFANSGQYCLPSSSCSFDFCLWHRYVLIGWSPVVGHRWHMPLPDTRVCPQTVCGTCFSLEPLWSRSFCAGVQMHPQHNMCLSNPSWNGMWLPYNHRQHVPYQKGLVHKHIQPMLIHASKWQQEPNFA